MQKSWKITETLGDWYSSDSTQQERSNDTNITGLGGF